MNASISEHPINELEKDPEYPVSCQFFGPLGDLTETTLRRLISGQVASRISQKDPKLWGEAAAAEAARRLGWLDVEFTGVPSTRELLHRTPVVRAELREAGVDRIVLSGMGGSSLAATVIASGAGLPLRVLDSTDPQQIRNIIGADLQRTAVVFSSKSGGTVEVDSHRRLFEQLFREAGIDPAERCLVVTDPGSPLSMLAEQKGYRVFHADPKVGGRYSALTAFGLVPTGLAGLPLEPLLEDALRLRPLLSRDSADNPGLRLGAALSTEANKIALLQNGNLGEWVEQLLAESTGKNGRGLLPVVLYEDPLSPRLQDNLPADLLLPDVLPVLTSLESGEACCRAADRFSGVNGAALVTGPLGAQFLLWEFATAVAGYALGVNPFDQPDVEAAKAATRELLHTPTAPKNSGAPVSADRGESAEAVVGEERAGENVQQLLRRFLMLPAAEGYGYLAVQSYTAYDKSLQLLRSPLASFCNRPVTFGWGPRFLHSTGQYHKGGPRVGVFLQIIVAEGGEQGEEDLPIPNMPFTFGELIRAQAAGDAAVLRKAGLPVLTLHTPSLTAVQELLEEVMREPLETEIGT